MTTLPRPAKTSRLVILGVGEFASIAHEYFTHDSPYEVAGFAADPAYLAGAEYLGLPAVPLDEMGRRFPPDAHDAFVAVTFTHLNRARARLMADARARGYRLATYVSSRALVWHNAHLGENCFVFENCAVQHFARVGDGVVVWSGSQILHRAVVEDHCFLSGGVVVAGYGEVGSRSFVGANAAVRDYVRVAPDCFVGIGAVVVKATEPEGVYVGNPARRTAENSLDKFVPVGVAR